VLATSLNLKEDITVKGAYRPTIITSYFNNIYTLIQGTLVDTTSSTTRDSLSTALAIAKANLASPTPS
jgi:hypothetical protein